MHKERPKPPFCTATFQQEASNILGLRVKDAMGCAQKLFEGININGEHLGLITYMRTDSTEIADEFITELKAFVTKTFGEPAYSGPQKSKKKVISHTTNTLINISFVDALVSIVSLQRSMLVSFDGMTATEIRIMNVATGSAVCIIVFLLGLNLVRNKKILFSKLKDQSLK